MLSPVTPYQYMILLEEAGAFPENVTAIIDLDDKSATKLGPRTYRKRILRYGRWQHDAAPGGILSVDRGYGRRLVENFTGKVFDTVGANIGHPKNDQERIATAAGDIVGLEDADDGVYATVTVPPKVAEDIDEGRIKGCSAGIIPEYVDKEIGGRGNVGPVLDHLAFTNKPYIKDLGDFSPVHLADDSKIVLLSLTTTTPPEGKTMDKTELIAKAKELGIDIEALEADAGKLPALTTELEAAKAKIPAKPVEEIAAEAKVAAGQELTTALAEALSANKLITLAEDGTKPSLSDVVGAIAKAIQEPKDALLLSEATADVDAKVKSGHILPTQRDAMVKVRLSDPDTFKALVPEKAIVDLAELGTTGAPGADGEVLLADGTPLADEVERFTKMAADLGL